MYLHSEFVESNDNSHMHMTPETKEQENEALLSSTISSVSTIEGRWEKEFNII